MTTTPYQRFVVVGHSRTGWHLLRTALKSHPNVVCHHEPFHDRNPQTFPHDTDARIVLDEHLFTPFPAEMQAVGFKIQYEQPVYNPWWQSVWRLLRADTGIKLIHLKRTNLLARLLSEVNALRTNRWLAEKGTRIPLLPPVTLDKRQCLESFQFVERQIGLVDEYFEKHESMDVVYEEMNADVPGTLAKVQEYLGVRIVPITPVTQKIERRLLSEAIANYAELKRAFQGTKWASFFEESPSAIGD
ncbi:hypothetical protein Pan216_25620 [Planctomycetes bacterium Pan216]|uniref:Sulfotransferase domain protein n=1 Tax=Kolteria novifilia TaxID=2527975 RepID=A0A518B3Y1_9BACT|nr:hypothetical protein Pan216_25620 [Planctomycetes bacterium Pan216]